LESSTQGLILFTISALSSLDEGVRIDALKVLDLLLDQVPLAIVQGWDYSSSANSNTANLMSGGGNTAGDVEGAMGDKVVEALLSIMRVRSAGLAVGQGGYTSASSADLSPSVSFVSLSC
jgi:pre-rRNA-processing protein IPI1